MQECVQTKSPLKEIQSLSGTAPFVMGLIPSHKLGHGAIERETKSVSSRLLEYAAVKVQIKSPAKVQESILFSAYKAQLKKTPALSITICTVARVRFPVQEVSLKTTPIVTIITICGPL